MKLVQINTFSYKATGSIMMGIHRLAQERGIESYVIWGRGRKPEYKCEFSIEDKLGIKFHGVYTRLTDRIGFASWRATKRLLAILDEIQPDIVHLHNLHGYYLNLEMLFNYLKEKQIKVVWTLHDCWAFTGHCAYYSMVGCYRWKSGCHDCPQKATYPKSSLMDASAWNWTRKKELFSGLNMTITLVSNWLAGEVIKSFLGAYPSRVIYNGVNLDVFKPTESSIREQYGLGKRFVILSVASEWTERKGLKDVIDLAKELPSAMVVVIGLKSKGNQGFPENLIALPRFNSQTDLIKMYSAADVLFNPSKEETFGMTLIESMACGTPPVAYNKTAFPEILEHYPELLVYENNVESAINIIRIMQHNRKDSAKWHTAAEEYEINMQYQEYLSLYRSLMEGMDEGSISHKYSISV